MKNLFKIFLIFLYFTLCFLFRDYFEGCLATNYKLLYSNLNSHQIESVNFQDNSAITQEINSEITNLQNNENNNPIGGFKKNSLSLNKYCLNIYINIFQNKVLAFNPEFTIYTRAP